MLYFIDITENLKLKKNIQDTSSCVGNNHDRQL